MISKKIRMATNGSLPMMESAHLTVAMEGVNDRTLAQQARQFQLAPAALSHFYLDPQRARSGLVLGYGNTSASRYLPALRTLNRLIAQHRRA